MSVRGFLTWYLLAIAFVGVAGASVVQGMKWQRAERVAAGSEASVPAPSVSPQQNIAATEAEPSAASSPPPPLRRPRAQRQHAMSRTATVNARQVSKRSVIAKAEHPVVRRPQALASAVPAETYRGYVREPGAASPWQGYSAYPPSPPPPYPPYAYRGYGPYVPAYARYGWLRPPYYSDF